jgi:hypothetical protein
LDDDTAIFPASGYTEMDPDEELTFRWNDGRWDMDLRPNPSATTAVSIFKPNASGTLARTEDFAAPPAIGNTTPAGGTFTTLNANNTVTLTGRFNQTANINCLSGTLSFGNGTQFIGGYDGGADRAFFFSGTVTSGSASARKPMLFDSSVLSLSNNGITLAYLNVDGNNILAERNGTAAQEFRIYRTFTDANNHERGFLRWSSNAFQIGTEKGSDGGTARALEVNSASSLALASAGNNPINLIPSGTDFNGVRITGGVSGQSIGFYISNQTAAASRWNILSFKNSTLDLFSIDEWSNANAFVSARFTIAAGGAATLTGTLTTTGEVTIGGNLVASTKNIVTDTATGTKIGTATTQKIGFFNATPVVQQAAVADATDAASTQDRLNDLLARLRTLGLIAT